MRPELDDHLSHLPAHAPRGVWGAVMLAIDDRGAIDWEATEETIARLRDVLPGRFAIGLTGRGPRGGGLPACAYRLRVVAVPPNGPAEAETIGFQIRPGGD